MMYYLYQYVGICFYLITCLSIWYAWIYIYYHQVHRAESWHVHNCLHICRPVMLWFCLIAGRANNYQLAYQAYQLVNICFTFIFCLILYTILSACRTSINYTCLFHLIRFYHLSFVCTSCMDNFCYHASHWHSYHFYCFSFHEIVLECADGFLPGLRIYRKIIAYVCFVFFPHCRCSWQCRPGS